MQNKSLFDAELNELEWLFDMIDRGVMPAVTAGGLMLQSLNMLVLLNKQLRNNAIRFLVAMSLVDVISLIVQLPFLSVPFIAHEGANASPTAAVYNEFMRRFYSRFMLYPISGMCRASNSWLAMIMSFDRCLALQPQQSRACASRCGISRRRLLMPAIIASILLAVILNISFSFQHQKSTISNLSLDRRIYIESDAGVFGRSVALALFSLTFLLPLNLLLLLNIILVYLLIQYRRKQFVMRRMRELQCVNVNYSSRNGIGFGHGDENRAGRGRLLVNANEWTRFHRLSHNTLSTAWMVFATSLVHLAFYLPGTAFNIFVLFEGQAMVRSNKWLVLGHHFSNVLVFVHCSFNWCAILYPNGQ